MGSLNEFAFGSSLTLEAAVYLWEIFTVSIPITFVSFFIGSIGVVNMIEHDSIRSAFDFNEIIFILKSISVYKYLKFYLGSLTLVLGVSALLFLVGLVISSLIIVLSFVFFDVTLFSESVYELVMTVMAVIGELIAVPAFNVFLSRSISLIYNMRENG
jgi:hypothetical protein